MATWTTPRLSSGATPDTSAAGNGWEQEPLVRIPYARLSEAEKAKDRGVWNAVREALKAHPLSRFVVPWRRMALFLRTSRGFDLETRT
jgi:hypothetical protein